MRYKNPGNPDYINELKNTFNNASIEKLNIAGKKLTEVLFQDLPQILEIMRFKTLTICVVPRAKAQAGYSQNQMLFKFFVKKVSRSLSGFFDGTDYIVRNFNTKTTHLCKANMPLSYNNDGPMPYPGITKDTCIFSKDIFKRDILLIDDIYTRTVNIDEDAIQALLDRGAKSVTFYAAARTKLKSY
ncbi:MAG: amidophosphoribosyltransferase [Desulfobacteraceae bacterium]|nr:amidophosphoribosyltransferase [Desulfobacteraceae bacterium]